MKRNKPLRSNPQKTREWKQRTAVALKRGVPVKKRAATRVAQEADYSFAHAPFLDAHRVCPVTGGRTEQVHHSAKREGRWLNLQRYWIAVSAEGHRIIEDHKKWAESVGLMVRISVTASEHIAALQAQGLDLHYPVFYTIWDGKMLHPDSIILDKSVNSDMI